MKTPSPSITHVNIFSEFPFFAKLASSLESLPTPQGEEASRLISLMQSSLAFSSSQVELAKLRKEVNEFHSLKANLLALRANLNSLKF